MPYTIPEYIEIKTAAGSPVAFLSPKSDGLKECWIDDEQNGACTLEFEIPLSSEKWQYLTDKYRIYADGKEFVINNADAVDRQRDGKKLTGKVKAHESWVLLGKKYQTISNDPQNTNPPWGAVIIVSGGPDLSGGRFSVGSAGHALYALLQDTDWTVGTVDVPGTYDLETEKESVLANINQMQEKWGGILVWDSLNHTVSLRDEATWQNYTGYQIRYAKNLKGINRVDDYDIVTRLFPFGENDLNIATVNGGLLYLDNQSYSTEVLEGVWYNQDIADQTQLKTQGEKQLAVMCRPRHNYKTEVLDLRSLPGYGHETFTRSDMVDLFDEEFGANARVRIIRYRHNVFQPWLCDMELGDPLEKIAASVAQSVLMAKFYKNVVMPNTSFQNLMKAIINTEATEINGASGDYTLIDGVSTWKDPDTGDLTRATPKGFIISSDGGQTWKTAISGEGIHADAGWVGKLNAGVVTIGAETTFADGYDPTKITADSVGMGVDSDCVGLFHFDGSLNSHKGVAADSDGSFEAGCFGQALKIATGKHLKVTGPGAEGTVTFRTKNLAGSPNGSVLVDVPQSDNSQGIRAGIASDGRLYAQDLPLLFNYSETTQADFNSGTLVDVTATSAGDLELKQDKFIDNCSSVSGWAVGGEGTPASDGSSFYASAYGSGSDWHGPTLTKSLGSNMGDLTCIVDVTWLNNVTAALGFLKIGLLNASSIEVAYIAFYDFWGTSLQTQLTAYAAGTLIFNSMAGTTYNSYSGTLKLVRSGSTWTFYTGNTLLGTLNGGTTTAIAQIKLSFQQYGTYAAVTTMKVNDINITTPYKSSGNREKVVDLSGANLAGGTKIEWSKTTPTNTTVKVETALSTDGGSTYGAFAEATIGQPIPGIASDTNLSNARLKIKETLSTTDTSVTPKLHSLNLSITEKEAETAYGPNKSTLTAWDAISLAWKVDRLSLVVNDSEAAYIENPGLPATFGSYLFVGSDRNSANAINTLVDELRLDRVYKEATIRTAWYKTGTPFYTSEDMRQWPGYMKLDTDGLKIYDSTGKLRAVLGSWIVNLLRKYGLKIIGGEIYASVIQSGEEGATSYIRLGDIWEPLEVVENGKRALNIWSSGGGMLQFYDTGLNDMAGQITPFNDSYGVGLNIKGRNTTGQDRDLRLQGRYVRIKGYPPYSDQWSIYLDGYTFVTGNLSVQGNLSCTGSKPAQQVTENYGLRYMYATEAPEIIYHDRGRGQLVNGECIIHLDPIYLETIEPDTELTPWLFKTEVYGEGEDIRVIEWGDDYFKVKECNGGTSNRKFGWWHDAIRKGYAGIRLMEVVD